MNRHNWIGLLPFYLLVIIVFIGIAKGGDYMVSADKQNSHVFREYSFVIDAGHGGVDTGATSCTGVLESDINLEIALRLDALMQFLGHDTVMIRRTDTAVTTDGQSIAAQKVSDLKERVRIVNSTKNAVLISIHQNTFSDSKYAGAQVFYSNSPESKLIADKLQSCFTATVNPGSNRKCKEAKGIYLMQNITCPGLLIECGFISNPEEETNLRNCDYQKKICCVISSVISTWCAS